MLAVRMASFVQAVLLICVLRSCSSFYLPGLAPVNYCPVTDADDTCKVRIAAVLLVLA